MKHISICVCTFHRPERLRRLLQDLSTLETGGAFTHSIVVVDNDRGQSAKEVVENHARKSPIAVKYCVEPQQNIALARNRAVENATGDFLAFIDDDEEPDRQWLLKLFELSQTYYVEGVLGPVLPRFIERPPEWIVRGEIFVRPCPETGAVLKWNQTRTGNVLFRRSIFEDSTHRFRKECNQGGEDVDFFRRMMSKGMRFVWCAEARVYELIPPERCRRSYLLRRALVRGRAPYNQGVAVLKSLVAMPLYTLALPLLFLFGQDVFMRYLIKDCDHFGRILAAVGIDVSRQGYVSQ